MSLKEIKLSVADTSFPTSIITEAVSKLKDEALLFLQHDAGKYFFTSEPNLNSLHLRKMENVEDTVVREIQKDLIRKNISDEHFQIFLNPRNPKDVPDTQEIKLVVFSNGGNDNQKRCRQFIDNYGQQPRVNRNTLVFLCPKEDELPILEKTIREYYAWDIIEREETKLLNDQQKKEVKDKKKEKSEYMIESLRNLYSIVYLPAANNSLKETDLGRYTYGKQMSLDNEVYQRLTNDGEILEKIAPLILKERYLKNDKDFIETKKLYQAFISTPGEMRLINEDVLKNAIRYGVKEGLFGIGELENGKPVCRYFKQEIESILPSGMLCEGEILIKESICIEQKKYPEEEETKGTTPIKGESETTKEGQEKGKPQDKKYSKVTLKLTIPPSELSKLASTVLYLSKLFKELDIKIDIAAKDGEISISDYEDKIKEAFMQSNIEIDDETLQ